MGINLSENRLRWALVAAWTGVIFLASTGMAGTWADIVYAAIFGASDQPGSAPGHFLAQKAFHVFLFAVLGWLVSPLVRGKQVRRLVLSTSFCLVVGTVSEGLQLFSDAREPRFSDVLLNGLSGALSSLVSILT